ncbi:MAG: hypothetical protein ABIY50_04100 [Ignavibacteria bacterium]
MGTHNLKQGGFIAKLRTIITSKNILFTSPDTGRATSGYETY